MKGQEIFRLIFQNYKGNYKENKKIRLSEFTENLILIMVAGGGFEPPTSGL